MRVLIACEESGAVTKEFRRMGHEAYSCDLLETSGDHPEWHIVGDCLLVIGYGVYFTTQDGKGHFVERWDEIILHPPCTHVTVSGNGTYADTQERIDSANWSANLFNLAKSVCEKVGMENPVGVLNSIRKDLPKPHYVDLWWFGTKEMKKTGWWLHGLPPLKPTNIVGPPPKDEKERRKWQKVWYMTPSDDRGKLRSKLDQNMSKAMAEQWG